jgi:hypothetical protein
MCASTSTCRVRPCVRQPLLVQRLFFSKPMIRGWAVLGLVLGALAQARSGFV